VVERVVVGKFEAFVEKSLLFNGDGGVFHDHFFEFLRIKDLPEWWSRERLCICGQFAQISQRS
jgi:hypothetical protein